MSKRSRKRRKRSFSQMMFWGMSGFMALSMIVSVILVALPRPAVPTSTPFPTWTALPTLTPQPLPTSTATPLPPEPSPTSASLPLPTVEATETVVGPAPATETPEAEPTLTITPTLTLTPTLTATPSSASLPFTFAVAGDSRDDPEVYSRVLEAVTADGSEFLMHTGDMVSNGTKARWREFQREMAGFPLPFYPVPGNHDALVGQLNGYLANSGAPAAHYSFDREAVHFTLADSHHGGISAGELAWLRDDLSATAQPVKMVFLHHPPFDPDGTDHIMAYGNEGFMSLMAEQDVDYVFAGHIHAYAREERDGVQYVITGGAGAPLYSGDHPQAFNHYLRVSVEDEAVSIEVIKV